MVFNYTFEVQSGPATYDDYHGEVYFDTDEYEWEYEVDEKDIAKALVDMHGDKDDTLEVKVKKVWDELLTEEEQLETLQETEEETFETLVNSAKEFYKDRKDWRGRSLTINAYTLLDWVLGDITYYAERVEDDLKEWFYNEAEQDFYDNK